MVHEPECDIEVIANHFRIGVFHHDSTILHDTREAVVNGLGRIDYVGNSQMLKYVLVMGLMLVTKKQLSWYDLVGIPHCWVTHWMRDLSSTQKAV